MNDNEPKTFSVGGRHPGASSPAWSRVMSARARKGATAPEMHLRRALHALGLRYRVQAKIPSRPRRTVDISFPRQRIAVFVDGCFWHGCPDHGVKPKSNPDWWQRKIATNQARDADTNAALEAEGWAVIRVWEHEAIDAVTRRIVREIGARRSR